MSVHTCSTVRFAHLDCTFKPLGGGLERTLRAILVPPSALQKRRTSFADASKTSAVHLSIGRAFSTPGG